MRGPEIPRPTMALLALAALFLPSASAQKETEGQQTRSDDPQALQQWLHFQKLQKAPPMGMPEWRPVQPAESSPGGLRRYNPATGQSTDMPVPERAAPGARRQPSQQGPRPLSLDGLIAAITPGRQPGFGSVVPQAATPPGPNPWTYNFPWNTHVKIVAEFTWGGVTYAGSCSASMASSFHVVTAGHCIYARDINRDGNPVDSVWVDRIYVWPAHTDVVQPLVIESGAFNPNGTPDYPYGVAMGTLWETYTAWIDNGDLNWDIGWITLDRRLGNYTGWMGRETNTDVSALNYNGYPVEEPFIRWYDPFQYPDFESVTSYTSNRINMAAFTWGGHSGGPVWRYDGVNNYLQGVNSTSDRAGNASAARLTNTSFDHLSQRISADENQRPPTARPDLIEFVFDTTSKDLLNNSAGIGGSFGVKYNVFNAGFADSGSVTVDFYLSSDRLISTGDYSVGSAFPGSLGAFTYTVPTTTLTVPTTVPPGTYYVGYIMRGAVPEYGTSDNTVIIPNETLTVTCSGDAYENDNSSGTAKTITAGATQTHSICPATDQDWVRFTLAAPSAVTLQTGGAGGDTRMWLYNSSLTQLDFNDDFGSTLFSRIERACGATQLAAGTYYVKVDEYLNNNVIPSYTLSLSTTTCTPPISVTPTSLTFGVTQAGTTSASQRVTVRNSGTASLTISSVGVTGDYLQTHTCGSPLSAGATCTIDVQFRPTARGTRTGTLSIAHNAPGSPHTVPLTGTGNILRMQPGSLSFTTQLVNTTSAARTITLSNLGGAPLAISGIALAGANPAEFTQSHTCGASLAAGASCTVSIAFRPAARGNRTATLAVTHDGGAGTSNATLSGLGTVVRLNPTALTFVPRAVGTTSPVRTATVTNAGAAPVVITSVAIGGTNPLNFLMTNGCPASLAPGASCNVSIQFKPNATGPRNASLNIVHDGGGSSAVALAGTGL